MEEYKKVVDGVEETMETAKPKELCEICPLLNIVHASGETTQIRYCVMDAALKQAKERYAVCGQELDMKFGVVQDTPVKTAEELEKELADKDIVADAVLDTLEKEVESL